MVTLQALFPVVFVVVPANIQFWEDMPVLWVGDTPIRHSFVSYMKICFLLWSEGFFFAAVIFHLFSGK